MAHLDPHEAFEHFRDRVVEGIKSHFPIQGRMQSLFLEGVEVKDALHPDDLRSQHKAKIGGASWSVPVYAHLTLKENGTDKVVSSRKIRVAEVPKVTNRYSFIVDGKEYQIDNQWQLKPGVYTRRRPNGELESHFNIVGRPAFDVFFDPASKQFRMEYHKSKLPLYPIMKVLGVDDDTLERSWGKEIFDANKNIRGAAGAVERFYKSDKKVSAPSKDAAEKHLYDSMTSSRLLPESTELTLGKGFDTVSGEALHLATQKLLKVQAGHPEDDRDSLVFKNLRTAGDFAFDKLRGASRVIQAKGLRKINHATDVRDVVKFDLFNEPIRQTFRKNSAARYAVQVNPVEMVASAMQTTIMGPGGIQSEQSIMDEAKFVNPSHLGFLDPINTPEGSKTGVTLRLPIGVKKVGQEPKIPLYNIKSGKMELVGPLEFMRSRVVLPDQVKWENNKPVPLSKTVKISGDKNDIGDVAFADAHYVMRHPTQLFNITSNLIPFLGNTSGGRAGMASRHIEQAISLINREAPLVQVATGVDKPGIDTFESLLGRQASHRSPISGVVHEVKHDGIVIRAPNGDKHEVHLYHNYPLNDAKSVMHSTPLDFVKPGASVKAGQILADTNYAHKGTLALGTNLRVGYVPFKGYNFEDGVVISESAAKKLSSVHLHKHALPLEEGLVTDPRKFMLEHHGAFKRDQLEKIDADGVVRVGQKVKPGDPLVLAMKPYQIKDRTGLAAIRRSLSGAHTDKSLRWDSEHEGEVVAVNRSGKDIAVHVRTVEPMQIGDKLAGRYGNKGIVTMILPDKEMPHTKDGNHVEVALNPSGVPGRMNVGQVLETAAAKVAQKTGKPYIVKNFAPIDDMLAKVKQDLAHHGLSDTEELHDPVTKQPLGRALVGPQHIFKLMHQIDKKMSVRSGMGLPGQPNSEHYDLNLQPSGGSDVGGQSMGVLGIYALLAHGAKANIREMQTWKSEGPDPQTSEAKRWDSQHKEVWNALQTGDPLPTPRPTFAFTKFTEMLRAAGVNIEKKGHQFILSPLTDKQILHMSNGELPKPAEMVFARTDKGGDTKPKAGGLFDERLTGGHGGRKWTHIKLVEPVPNPIFEGPIKHLTGLTQKEFDAVVHGQKSVNPTGKIVELGDGTTGGAGIRIMLDQIDVKKELETSKKELAKAPASKIDKLLKRVKYLQALDQLNLKPSEAYILNHIPVMPPALRPISVLPSGDLKHADINQLYKEFAIVNEQLRHPTIAKGLPEEAKRDLRRDLYDGVRAIVGIGVPYDDAKHKGIIHQIQGTQAKAGYFQKILMNRRQDLTMRSTIVPEPALGLDEVGLPRHAALDLYRPFVVKELVQMGAAPHPLAAQEEIKTKSPSVWKALDRAMEARPVLLKRDPSLHKHSVQAFKPRAVHGNAIQIHPLVCGGFNADFDGDTMSVFVPVHRDAVAEAHRMFPSNNLFSEATGKLMYQPTLESALGLYKLSLIGQDTSHKFAHPGEAIEAVRAGKIGITDLVHIGGQKTTPGRVLLAATLPDEMHKKVLTDHGFRIDKKGLDSLLTDLAKNHRHDFGTSVNRLKDIGNDASFGVVQAHPGHNVFVPIGTHTLSLSDFEADKKTRDRVLGEARKKVDAIYASSRVPSADKDRQAIAIWSEADRTMKGLHEQRQEDKPTNLFTMYKAGVKPGWEQYKQMVLAPMLFRDSTDRIIPTPVVKSYAEGLDVAGYWTHMHGARRGAVMKVQEVRDPGYMSKLLMSNTMNLLVSDHDCGTDKGIPMSVVARDSRNNEVLNKDALDRHLANDLKIGNLHLPAGTPLTVSTLDAVRAAKKDAQMIVRSPLKCEEEKGICQKCMGLNATGHHHELGTNVGVHAAHAVGERAVQLTLKAFHTGGVQEQRGGGLLNSFARFEQLMHLDKKIPNAATLSMTSGKVEKVESDATGAKVWINGRMHHVPKDSSGMPLHVELPHASKMSDYQPWQPPKIGMHVSAGQHLSDPNRTQVNPHHLYAATRSIEQVQNHLTKEIHNLYKDEGITRGAIEVVVKAMSNLTKVSHPGDHHEVLRGEFYPTSVVRKMNEELVRDGRRPIEHMPVLKGVDMMPLSLQEDWMAKLQHERLKSTLLEAAATRGVSNIHSMHPVPGIAFGAEFGLTSAVSKRPEYKHLSNVPAHHY